ncbi:hypothetical protein SO802_000202 [Lithocarpus litseifolius]|uniref:Purple acid phosphatase n=1 Tax=Lithocarpus litseifolius TaxID=425828 RepID=A0AAW2DUC5_9ROSI
MRGLNFISLAIFLVLTTLQEAWSHGDQPLSKIAIHKATVDLNHDAYVKASPTVLGLKEQTTEWVTLEYSSPKPSADDWIGVFSPANFNASTCPQEKPTVHPPLLCSAPIKYQFANYSSPKYKDTGKGYLKLQLINQRSDFSFELFSGGLSNPKLVAISNQVAFANPNAPVYPRLAQGKQWNEMTVTWTSGYGINEAGPFVEWGPKGGDQVRSPAGTLTFDRNSMCGAPARTVGWRDPGFIHTSFLKELWPNAAYTYKLGHKLFNGTYVWSRQYQFRASPYPGQNSLQRVVIFGDMGKDEADGSNEYNNYQRGSLNTTRELITDLKNIDLVLHIGDICYANGYISQWDQFTAQVEPIASTVPYMIASGNHERDWPGTGSFYGNTDSGGECGVLAETMFYVPAENRAKFWYSTDYGMFRFCIADTEHDWREGTEQYKFIEHCLASVDRQKQPWLIFLAHRVLGYSSGSSYADEGSFEEPMGRESLQKLWQKYKVDIAVSVVVFDEAHNIDNGCIEALSVSVRRQTLEGARRNLNKMRQEIEKFKATDAGRLRAEYNRLVEGLAQRGNLPFTDNWLSNPALPDDILKEAVPGNIRRAEHFLHVLRRLVQYLEGRLETDNVEKEGPVGFVASINTHAGIDQKTLKFCYDRLHSLMLTLEITDTDEFLHIQTICDFATLVGTYTRGFSIIIEPFDERMPHIPDPVLQLSCHDASLAIKPVFDRFQSVVITSGTLSPIDLYPRLLNFHPVVSRSFTMSLTRDCICPMVLTRGSDQLPVSTKFDMRSDLGVVRNYGRLLLEMASVVPDGIEIMQHKLVFIETQDVVETTLALDNYRKACDCGRGAIFFSVARGKVAEGIDFDRHYGSVGTWDS